MNKSEMALNLYYLLGTVITGLLGWVSVKLNAWLKAKTKNELVGGIVARLSDSVFTAVKTVHQTARREIERAKDPASPGGAAITPQEAEVLRGAVWSKLKLEYGGMEGLSKLLGVIGLTDADAVKGWVDNRIEAAVHDTRPPLPSPTK